VSFSTVAYNLLVPLYCLNFQEKKDTSMEWWLVVVAVVAFVVIVYHCCCKASKEETSNTPEIEYNSNQNYQSLPTSMRLPQSALRDNGYSFEPHAPMVTPYPPEPSSLGFGHTITGMPQPFHPESSSSLHNVNITPYPPEAPPVGFGYPEMPQPSTSSGIANVTPYPLTIRMPQPSEIHTHSTPQFSDTPPPYVQTRSHSAEELPPSYAEAVQKESQLRENHPRRYVSEISTYDNV